MRKSRPEVAERSRRSGVQSAGTTVAVLKALTALGGSASLTALAERLEESPAKVHRYLVSLLEGELVLQDPVTARYLLGPEAIAIGLAAMRQSDVLTLTAPQLAGLAQAHRLSCFVALWGNHGPTIVRWDEPVQPVTVNVRVGSVLPVLWAATGRAFGAFGASGGVTSLNMQIQRELASASPEQRRLLPHRHAVDALFETIVEQGCAPVRDVLLKGVSALAAPIFDAAGQLAAVLTALGPSGGFDPTPGGATASLVLEAANAVSTRLGHRTSTPPGATPA